MARKPAATAVKAPARNGPEDALKDLHARAARNSGGACQQRSDPLADAKAAVAVVAAAKGHQPELTRRGLGAAYSDAALKLAHEIEAHLQALPAAAVSARGRSSDDADVLADAANTAQAIRAAVLRVTRAAGGRAIARDFGLGEPFSARQPAHVMRALRRILAAAQDHEEVAGDLGLLREDLQTLTDLAGDLAKAAVLRAPVSDEQERLAAAQGALRAFFDLFAAKASIAFAGDPGERTRLLALIPRADERRKR